MLPTGHQAHIRFSVRRLRLVYGLVFFGVALEIGLGLVLWRELSALGAPPDRSATAWWFGLAALSALQATGAFLVRRGLLRPDPIARRLRTAWKETGSPKPLPPELLTVAAVRAAFIADVIGWILLQFITIYGLVAMVLVSSVSPLVTFTALSVLLLAVAYPRTARVEALAEALHATGAD